MIDPTPERAQQAQMLEAFAEKVDGRKVMMAWEREHNVAFMEALNAGAAALRALSAREWMPIESAPKDGTWVLGYWGGPGDPEMCSIRWGGKHWLDSSEACDESIMVTPTHWQPLPALPPSPVGGPQL